MLAPVLRTAAVGKWHLQSSSLPFPAQHPMDLGFEQYLGGMNVFPGFISNDYWNYVKNENGVEFVSPEYATSEQVDDALDVIAGFGNQPWFVMLSFHAPHAPFHKPPPALHSFILPAAISSSIPLHVKATIEAMDTELARLFAKLDPAVLAKTVVIFVGDNGTDRWATTAPNDPLKAKPTLYEGGINVPLIVKGPGVVPGSESAALVSTTDLFATVAGLAGQPAPSGVDSVSLVPYFANPALPSLRTWVYSEFFSTNGFGPFERRDRTVRNSRYKLLRLRAPYSVTEVNEFYDLLLDPFEKLNLMASPLSGAVLAAYTSLDAVLRQLEEPFVDQGHALPSGANALFLRGEAVGSQESNVAVQLSKGPGPATAHVVVGLASALLPFKDGTLVPFPHFIGPAQVLSASGSLTEAFTWPPGFSGFQLWLQYWVPHFSGPDGFIASNGLRITAP